MKRKILAFITAMSIMLSAIHILGYAEDITPDESNNAGLAYLQGLMMDSDTEAVTIHPPKQRISLFAEGADNGANTDWCICIYMCGTDLESNYSAATSDIIEMLQADIPQNVRIMVMTGGTKNWNPYGDGSSVDGYIEPSSEVTQLYEIDDEKMTLVRDYESNMDMGKADTAALFLEDCLEYAPSERMMVSFWDHGGGPFHGVSFDENSHDGLSLSELQKVLTALKDARGGKKLELLGFDACLMNTFEIGCMMADTCDYMVASEETEPGTGWDYRWLSALNEEYTDNDEANTLEAKELGCEIIDNYAFTTDQDGEWSNIKEETLALLDLSQMDRLKTAFNDMAYELNQLIFYDEKFAKIARAAEKVQHMYEDYGLLDLYDFAHDIYEILPEDIPAAKSVMEVLGEIPGTASENFVGAVTGENPAVVYRGTGLAHNECIGIAFYYPTSKTTMGTANAEVAKSYVDYYRKFGISEFYTAYLISAMVHADTLREFNGTIQVTFDEESYHYVMQIENLDDAVALRAVNYINIFTDMTPGEEEKNYLLGTNQVEEDWENARFTEQFDGYWYTLNGELFSLNITPQIEEWEKISIPVMVDGEDSISVITAYRYTGEYEQGIYAYIDSVTAETYNEDGSAGAPRTYRPEGDFTFYTLLPEYSLEEHSITGYRQSDNPVTVSVNEETGLYLIGDLMDIMPLSSGQTALYTGYFEAIDIRGNKILSDPCSYILLDDFEKEMSVEEIPTQVYTGEPITPKVHLLFMGDEILTEDVDYKVEYKDNIERGWATVTITSLMDELPGTLTVQFEIKDSFGIVEDRILSLLDDHLPGECEDGDEQQSHTYFTEQAKLAYERLEQADRSRISDAAKAKLKDQYDAMLRYMAIAVKDNDVELIGALYNMDWSEYLDDYTKSWLYAKQEEPLDANAAEALAKAQTAVAESNEKVTRAACYNIKFLAQKGNDEPDRVEIAAENDSKVLLKIKLSSKVKPETLQIYRIAYGENEPQKMNITTVNESSENYVIFETDTLGYFALFAENKPSARSGSGGGGSAPTAYTVTFETNGGSNTDKVKVTRNDKLNKPAEPTKDGYIFDGWYTDKELTTAYDFDGKVTKSFTLYAKWNEEKDEPTKPTEPTEPLTPSEWKNPFTDIKPGNWFYDNVRYAYENKLFAGVSDSEFAPNSPMTRAMLVTVLYRAEGEPDIENEIRGYPFADVDAESWYGTAVYWARMNGIVKGYSDEEFAPDQEISREQIAAILQRYADFKGKTTDEKGDLSPFTDASQISDWARGDVEWAVGTGLISGKGNGVLDPIGSATRAEVAAMLHRFLEK